MKFSVNLVEQGEVKAFDLQEDAEILDLKTEVAKEEGLGDPDRICMYFRTDNGLDEGIEDDEKVVDVSQQSGEIQAKISPLSFLNGQVKLEVEESIIGGVAILMGGRKSFEHFVLNNPKFAMKIPNGK